MKRKMVRIAGIAACTLLFLMITAGCTQKAETQTTTTETAVVQKQEAKNAVGKATEETQKQMMPELRMSYGMVKSLGFDAPQSEGAYKTDKGECKVVRYDGVVFTFGPDADLLADMLVEREGIETAYGFAIGDDILKVRETFKDFNVLADNEGFVDLKDVDIFHKGEQKGVVTSLTFADAKLASAQVYLVDEQEAQTTE